MKKGREILTGMFLSALLCAARPLYAQQPEYIHPIASLSSEDFSDLDFLEDVLFWKRIVMMGECTHGTREMVAAKVRLVKYLHEQLGYNVVALEDNIGLWSAADSLSDSALLAAAVDHTEIWGSPEMLELMHYVNTHPDLKLAGFDVPVITQKAYDYYIQKVTGINPTLKGLADSAEYLAEDYLSQCYYKKEDSYDYAAGKAKALDAYKRLKQVLGNSNYTRNFRLDSFYVTVMLVDNRMGYIRLVNKGDPPDKFYFHGRDSIMALNIRWWTGILRNEKIAVISHNMHISRRRPRRANYWTPDRPMGSMLTDEVKRSTYVLAINAYSGTYWSRTRKKIYELSHRNAGSIEAYMHKLGYPYAFIDLQYKPPGLPRKSYTNSTLEKMPLYRRYDGILFIDKVSAREGE